jgi:hypothetical protein
MLWQKFLSAVNFILHFFLDITRIRARAHKAMAAVNLRFSKEKRYHEKCIYFQSAALWSFIFAKALSSRIKVYEKGKLNCSLRNGEVDGEVAGKIESLEVKVLYCERICIICMREVVIWWKESV